MELKVRLFREERGSISLVVLTFFLITVTTSLIITDIAAVAIAKRSLTQATEAAAQRGVRNLNHDTYYSGEFDLSTAVGNIFSVGPKDPGIPIDCSKALGDSEGALADWSRGPRSLKRVELSDVSITDLQCDGFGIGLITTAIAHLPIAVPIIRFDKVEISSRVSTTNTRKDGFSPFGIRVF